MGRKCFVPNCNSGYSTCKEKVTIFHAPSNPERLEAWARAIPHKHRALGPSDGVCRRHFTDDMIVKRRYFAELGGEVLLDVPKRLTLAEDAVPCIFPSSLAPAPKKRKRPASRHSPPSPPPAPPPPPLPPQAPAPASPPPPPQQQQPAVVVLIKQEITAEATDMPEEGPEVRWAQEEDNQLLPDPACNEASRQTFPEANVVGTYDQTATMDTHVAERLLEITKSDCPPVCLDPSNVHLPNLAWNHHTLCQEGLHSFWFIEACVSSSGKPEYLKALHVQQVKEAEFTLTTFARDHKIEPATVPRVCQLRCPDDWSVVTAALKDLDDLNICPGEPVREIYAHVRLERGYMDTDGVWRHKRCPIVQVGQFQCSFCARLKDTLRIHKSRKEKRQDPQRVRIALMCPSIKAEVDLLRRQRIACYRSKMRLLKTKEKLTAELKYCREKLKYLGENSHKTLQEETRLEAQQVPVTECVSAVPGSPTHWMQVLQKQQCPPSAISEDHSTTHSPLSDQDIFL